MIPASSLALAAALSVPTLAGAHVGALVIDARTGATIYSQNAAGAFQPASTLKLLVGSAALSLLGPDYAFETAAATDAPIAGGTLAGALYLRGGGDPTLDAQALADAARTLRALAIERVEGEIVADASHFNAPAYPPGWVIDDLPDDYAAPVSGLSYNDNMVALALAPGERAGSPITIVMNPATSALEVANAATTGPAKSDDTTTLERVGDDPQRVRVSGSLPADASGAELDAAIPVPALFAAGALRDALRTAGISANGLREGPAPAGARVVWTHRSAPMRDLLARMWLPSDNLLAESLLEELGANAPHGNADTRELGIAREESWLRTLGIDPQTLTIADGSGLSQYDRATPAALVTVLRSMWLTPQRDTVLAALPVAGERGTLKSSFAQSFLRGQVFAKTGSMSHVRALAGYIVRPGRTMVFALLVDDWTDASSGAGAALRLAQQQFLEAASMHP